jgi:hypothetical protein
MNGTPSSSSAQPILTIFERIDQNIENNTKIVHKVVAKVFAYIAYFLTIILPLADGFLKMVHCIVQKTRSQNHSTTGVDKLFTVECKTFIFNEFNRIYKKIFDAARNGKFVQISRKTIFDRNSPDKFEIKLSILGNHVFYKHSAISPIAFQDQRRACDQSKTWVSFQSKSGRSDLLIPRRQEESAANISCYVLDYEKDGWDRLAQAAVAEMERLLIENRATTLVFCTDGLAEDWLHLRFEDIK